MATEFTGEIHPLADELPMLPADELAELAQDIAANGLTDPLTLDAEGRLLDGRNRLAACGIAGVEPTFVVYEGDPISLVVSRGALRRNITSAQRAMLIAKDMWRRGLWDEAAGKWQYGAKSPIVEGSTIDRGDLARCGAILAHREAWATDILRGVKQLRAAYDQALKERRDEVEAEQQRETLRTDAPDLYRYLTSEPDPMPLDEAWAAYLKRTEEEREAEKRRKDGIRTTNEWLWRFVDYAKSWAEHPHLADTLTADYDEDPRNTPNGKPITKHDIGQAIAGLTALQQRWST